MNQLSEQFECKFPHNDVIRFDGIGGGEELIQAISVELLELRDSERGKFINMIECLDDEIIELLWQLSWNSLLFLTHEPYLHHAQKQQIYTPVNHL
jgi:hypothetical protein